MRFVIGPVPADSGFEPGPNWSQLREPAPQDFVRRSQVAGLALGVIALGVWTSISATPLWPNPTAAVLAALPIFAGILPLHEAVHGFFHPGWGLSTASIYGVWPSHGLFYALYSGELSRNRLLLVLLAPLVCMSAIPLLFSVAVGVPHWLVVEVAILSACIAGGDVTAIVIVLAQVPANAFIRNVGYYTWWRPASGSDAAAQQGVEADEA